MSFWTEIHWSEGMFLRPHHLQGAQRWFETVINAGFSAARPFAWGFLKLKAAEEPLENFTLRLDECLARMKDGTWVCVPENMDVPPLDFKQALGDGGGSVEVLLGIPEIDPVSANSVPLEDPTAVSGNPRYDPKPDARRDENTGKNRQTIHVRRIRGRLFTGTEDATGYETIRVGTIVRTDRPGSVPEFRSEDSGPQLAVQAHGGLSSMLNSLVDQIEAKNEVLAREAREHRMLFTDGVAANTEHLLKLHALNESRGSLRASLQSPVLHPYDVFVMLSTLIGRLAVFHDQLTCPVLPKYDHDRPGKALGELRTTVEMLLDAMRPAAYIERPFVRQKDQRGHEGLQVELDRAWIDGNLEMYVGLVADDIEIDALERHVYGRLNLKLASPTRAPRLASIAVRGLRLQVKSVPAGALPRRTNLHYFRIDKTIGPDRTDYWRECEQERGIRITIQEGQLAEFEQFQPTLYVILKERK